MPDETLPARLSFSKTRANLQIAWDSTSLGALKTCPRYYEYNILKGYVHRAENVHLRFGQEFHSALEAYDRAKASGATHDEATLLCVRKAMTSTWDEALNRPWTSDEPTKTRETLIRSIIWYLAQFEHDSCETIILASGQPAVELSFRFSTGIQSELTDEFYLLCGYLDRMVNFQDQPWIMDRKTTKGQLEERYFAGFSPDNQMSLYKMAAEIIYGEAVAGIIIDGCQLGVTFSRFQRAQVHRTMIQLDEWFKDTIFWIKMNEKFVQDNYWPMNDKACGMYGGCPYRAVCSTSPELRPRLLEGLFSRRAWDPLQIREP